MLIECPKCQSSNTELDTTQEGFDDYWQYRFNFDCNECNNSFSIIGVVEERE